MIYRPDIQGLRGLSVIAVLLFHLGVALPGGFVGVDVFFVISGFLMTGLIADEFARRGTISFVDFYARRIRRIFPALLVMIVVVTALGYFLLLPGDYRELAQSGVYAALSLGNVFFLLSTGYFDIPAEAKGLLHTWSLGVEEQFYLVWPAVMLALLSLAKGRRELMLALLLAVVGAGFLGSVYAVHSDPKAAFYLLHARLWELAAGGLLVFVPQRKPTRLNQVLPAAGLVLIIWSAFSLSPEAAFPGWNALPAVLGAALIVNPASACSLVSRGLALRPLAFIGTISYSLYLWHWPLIVLWRQYRSGAALALSEAAMLAAAALLVAGLSWRWFEEPFRKARSVKAAVPLGLAAAAAVAAIALGVVAGDGFPGRIDRQLAALSSLETMWDWRCPQASASLDLDCVVGADWETAAAKGAIWGDSHAEHLLPLLDLAGRETGRSIALFGDCPPIYYDGGLKRVIAGFPNYDSLCTAQRARYFELLRSSPEIEFVAVASRWSAYLADTYRNQGDERSLARGLTLLREGLEEFVAEVAPLGRKIVLVGEMPQFEFDPIPCVMLDQIQAHHLRLWRDPGERERCKTETRSIPRQEALRRLSAPNDVLSSVASAHAQVQAFFPSDAMCEADCVTTVAGEFLFRDSNHLRRNLSPEALDRFATLLRLRELLRRLGGARSHETGNDALRRQTGG